MADTPDLDAIRNRVERRRPLRPTSAREADYVDDCEALLVEIERLRAVVRAAEALVDQWHSEDYWDDYKETEALDIAVQAYRAQRDDDA